MKLAELRSVTDDAFRHAGLVERKLFPKGAKVWCLPGNEVIRFFQPQPYRRTWGFVFTGYFGIEIPALRAWLAEHHPDDAGIFRHSFEAYHSLNESDRRDFMIEHERQVPAELWAGRIRDRLELLPASLEELLSVYLQRREALGRLAHPITSPAWDFLLKWNDGRDALLDVPKRGPEGRIV